MFNIGRTFRARLEMASFINGRFVRVVAHNHFLSPPAVYRRKGHKHSPNSAILLHP